MTYLKLAWRNLWRNRKRTFITAASVIFAVFFSIIMVSMQDGTYDNMIRNVVGMYSGYIQVHKQGFWEEQSIDHTFEQNKSLEEEILQNKNIRKVIPRLESFALAASDTTTRGTVVVGISPLAEQELTNIQSKITEGSYLTENDDGCILATGLATYLKVGVGDTIILLGQGYQGMSAAGRYPVKALIKLGSPEMNNALAYLSLREVQRLYAANNRISAYVLDIPNPQSSEKIARSLRGSLNAEEYEVMNWEAMMPELVQLMQADKGGNYIVLFILYLIIGFGIFGTILMMTTERKFEFGVLVAIGMKKHILAAIVTIENIFVALLGTIIGCLISMPLLYYFYTNPIQLSGKLAESYVSFGFEPIFPFAFAPYLFYTQAIVVLLITLVLSIYPIIKIYRLEPVKAMRD